MYGELFRSPTLSKDYVTCLSFYRKVVHDQFNYDIYNSPVSFSSTKLPSMRSSAVISDTFDASHSRPQSTSLLRMTDGEKSSGQPWNRTYCHLKFVETMKTPLIGQSVTRQNLNVRRNGFPGPWELNVCALCKSKIVHAIVICVVFGCISVWRRYQQSRSNSSLLK